VKGRAQPGATTTFEIWASIAPITRKRAQLLPEGIRSQDARTVVTRADLQTAEEGGQVADEIEIDGEAFVIHECPEFPGLLAHETVLAVRKDRN
jgi:hypothetical protein